MRNIKTIKSIQTIIRRAKSRNKKIGFVPTMGYFHEGHLSLMRKSKKENDITIVSIFVNPAQFGPGEDFSRYPRDKKRDLRLARKEKVDIILSPSEKEIYPNRYLTYLDVTEMDNCLCGRRRPGHFRGVATIVCKLLNIVSPDVLYLGQKDAQQAAVIKKMVEDLNAHFKIKVLPIIREGDGLAMSSRNRYLSHRQRKEAVVLFKSLKAAKRMITSGERKTRSITKSLRDIIRKESSAKIDYVECVNAETLTPLRNLKGNVLIALAAYFGNTRLIDNIRVNIK